MGAIVNGLVLHGLRAFGSTFFNFSDYMKGAMRLAAIMELPAIYVFTHDSIGLGEDGPTHQPIEQLAHLRADAEPVHGAPVGRERDGAGLAVRDRARRGAGGVRAQPPGAADLEPERRARRRHPPRRVRAARLVQGRRPGPDPDRHRLRGAHLRRGGRPARGRRDRHARGLGALPRALRRAGRRLPRRGAAAGRARARVGRGGRHVRLGRVDHRRRRPGRHDRLRRLGAAAGAVRALRLHRRERGRPRAGGRRAAGGSEHERRSGGQRAARGADRGRAPASGSTRSSAA